MVRFFWFVCLYFFAASSLVGIGWAQDLSKVKQETIQLSDTVYLIVPNPPYGGNLAVSVGDDGILLVDDQMMPMTPGIREAIARLQEGGIKYLVNTHYHYDHAGGNEAFGKDSVIVAQHNVHMRLAEGREAGARFIEGKRPIEALPDITFESDMRFYWNGEAVDVIHFPNSSHTDGDSVIYFRDSNVVHTGDQYVNLNGFPYIDRDVGGSATGLRDNIGALLELIDDETKIIPGHGPLATKGDLEAFYSIVADSISIVRTSKEQGKSLDEIQQTGLPKRFDGVVGFMPAGLWIQFVFDSLND
tara:strand:+ start:246 stop:1151 length:906 start_codon:yes stop_codon:yes gene_type:complete